MDNTTGPPNPPSIEAAYKRKCIALKKRLNEIEAENDIMRTRNKRSLQYVQKMRLESCILLERLAKVTGMVEEAQTGMNPELRARATTMMSNAMTLNNMVAAMGAGGYSIPLVAGTAGNGARPSTLGPGYLADETEGSSEERPPTPQERPLRVKRSRKSTLPMDDENANNAESATAGGLSSLPPLAPAPSQEQMTSSFRVRTGSSSSAALAASAMDVDVRENKRDSR
ncbi:hypothetical protein Egran_02522 [Elaphomyces granulatus]|uniref:INO80 complex subunit F domain-containing protein n=1 Tax=Elaphomyces granulatus TaxID=519963 RepID=A0A232M017_9EURO|nr:hypothetical protein Egran_02522 [Elaphomyces granulatus]